MKISLENRSRIVLLLFCFLDHLIWIYGGHLKEAALFYIILSECARIFALIAVMISLWNPKVLRISITMLIAYCMLMAIMNYCASSSYTLFNNVSPNIFLFKKDRLIPVEHGFFSTIFYIYMLAFAYFFSIKRIPTEIVQKK